MTEAQQSLNETTLTSPIAGTVVSVGINVGDTVSAGSSTEIITIIGTNSYEAEATLDSSQVPSVKVGQTTSVEVDGDNGNLAGSVAQVGPVQSSSSGYSYPVVVALPASAGGPTRRFGCEPHDLDGQGHRTWSPYPLRPSRRRALSAM